MGHSCWSIWKWSLAVHRFCNKPVQTDLRALDEAVWAGGMDRCLLSEGTDPDGLMARSPYASSVDT